MQLNNIIYLEENIVAIKIEEKGIKCIGNSTKKGILTRYRYGLGGHGNICVRNGTNVLRKAAKTAYLTLR